VETAIAAGLEACSGGIIGLGETMEDRVDLALQLKKPRVASVPLNVLMPIPGTPAERFAPLAPMEILHTIALFRFILPDRQIKIAGGRMGGLRDLHSWIFMAGASGFLLGDYLTNAAEHRPRTFKCCGPSMEAARPSASVH